MKIFLISVLLVLGVNFTYAQPKDEPAAHCYVFVSKCDRCYTIAFDHELSELEYSYYEGFYDALCDRHLHEC